MRILYISDRLNAPDGSAVHGREFTAHMRENGHTVLTYPEIRPEPDSLPRPVPRSEKNFWYYLKKINWQTCKYYLRRASGYAAEALNAWDGIVDTFTDYFRLKHLVATGKPDVIIYRVRLFNVAPFWVGRQFEVPVVCEVNTLKSIEEVIGGTARVTWLTRFAEKKYLRAADAIFTVAGTIADEIVKYSPACRIEVIPNGVDTAKFDPRRFDRQSAKKSFGLENKTVLGYVGSYQKWHGLETSLAVIEALNRKDPRYHLLLVGNGTCYNEITQLISGRKLGHCVTRVGSIAHEDIPRCLAALDYALMTYPVMEKFYFSPLKMFEYMAMAIPVVATAIGQIEEVLENGKTGILIREPSAARFAESIEKYSGQAAQIGLRARRLAESRYSWAANARSIGRLCQKTLAAKTGATGMN